MGAIDVSSDMVAYTDLGRRLAFDAESHQNEGRELSFAQISDGEITGEAPSGQGAKEQSHCNRIGFRGQQNVQISRPLRWTRKGVKHTT